jgi:lantibiotic biosynthesis protein
VPPSPLTPRPSALESADRIGSQICRDAVWSGDACNWLDWSGEEFLTGWVAVHRALGSTAMSRCGGVSLYDGSAGIALFLARLYQQTGEPLHGETLLGATRQISAQLDELDGDPNVGFYAGWQGASWALTEIGQVLDDDRLIERELARLETTARFEPALPHTDLISGSAGLITSLVDLHVKHGRESLLDIAVRHGDFLLESASRSKAGWSWESVPVPIHRNLTGLAHGVSGIVCALAELTRATGEDRFRQAIDEGLRYESSHFSQEAGNWRDFREDAAVEGEPAFQLGWCHGAPGIGLARFRLIELGFDTEANHADLEAALSTTVSKLHYADLPGQREFCICHGLTGDADLPLLISQWPGRESLAEHAERVAQTGIELFEETGRPWAYNLGGTGETPTLFCGMAGIGHFYLRLAAPRDVPSILLIQPPHAK